MAKLLSIFLFCLATVLVVVPQSVAPLSVARRFEWSPAPLLLHSSVCSEVASVSGSSSLQECSLLCLLLDCAAFSWNLMSGLCQAVRLLDASNVPGPAECHVRRLVGAEAGAAVWLVEGFSELLKARQIGYRRFVNTSTGRLGVTQSVLINMTGCYRIEVSGAKGGDNIFNNNFGGRGALVAGRFNLTAGLQLTIVVGQAGSASSSDKAGAGGGGGSFVYRAAGSGLLMAAGGGGGASLCVDGSAGSNGVNGKDSRVCTVYAKLGFGGSNGQPGFNNPDETFADTNHGGCGAGWLGKAVNPRRSSSDGNRGGSRADGWVGGSAGDGSTGVGGFGGGGGGGAEPPTTMGGAAGAGGGFSGGGAGLRGNLAGGGGGSFCGGFGCEATDGGNSKGEHGSVELQLLDLNALSCQ